MHDATLWAERYDGRFDWAMQAQRDLVDTLADPAVRQLYENAPGRDATCVAVLGPTQVGKTTVILHLLGLTEEGAAQVGELLRGTRAVGQSATASAAIYGASPDGHFRYKEPEGAEEVLDAGAFERRLKELRGRVERGLFRATDAVTLRFPLPYFECDADGGLHVIDLPGLDARNRAEQDLTEQLLKRYLPLAPLVLLVERAENVAALSYLTVPGLGQQWSLFPDRYAVVLTRAVSARSVQEHLVDGRIQTLEQLREHHRSALADALRGAYRRQERDPDEVTGIVESLQVHPLDLGDSRQTLGGDVPVDLVDRLMTESSEGLREQMQRATTPVGRLALTAGLYRGAMEVKARLERDYARTAADLDAGIERATLHLKRSADHVERHLGAAQAAAESRLDVQEVIQALVEPHGVGHFEGDLHGHSQLIGYLNWAGNQCEQTIRRALQRADTEYGGANKYALVLAPDLPRRARNLFEAKIQNLRNHLQSYKGMDRYLFSGNRNRDRNWASHEVPRAVEEVMDLLRKEIGDAVQKVNEQAATDQARYKTLVRTAQRDLAKARSDLAQLKYARRRHQREHEARIARIDNDIEIGRRFHEFLRTRFEEAFARGNERMRAPGLADAERLYQLANLHLITKEYGELTAQTQILT